MALARWGRFCYRSRRAVTGTVAASVMPPLLNPPSFFGRRRLHATQAKRRFEASRCGARRGFTLVEAMVATMVFMMVILGVYSAIIKAYQISQLTRYNDQARAVLLSYIDQFQRLETADNNLVRPFFTPALPTGSGMDNLNRLNDSAANAAAVVTATSGAYIEVTLGDGGGVSPITARVTRSIYPVDVATGALLATTTATTTYYKQPGYSLVGIFTISYTLPSGKTYTQRLSTSRAIP